MAEWPDTFWAERIEIGLSREFMAALRSELPGWTVCESVCGDVAPDISIKLDLIRLDYLRTDGRLNAVAQIWVNSLSTLRTGVQAPGHAYDDLHVPVTPDTAQGQATAYSSLLRRLAKTGATLAVEQQQSRGRIEVQP